MSTSLGSKPIAVRRHVGLENRFEHNLGRRLNDAVTNRRDRQRPLLGRPGLGDPNPTSRKRSPSIGLQVRGQLLEPPIYAVLLDLGEGDPVDASRALIGAHLTPRSLQDISAPDLVVERVEASSAVGLGRPVKRPLQISDSVSRFGGSSRSRHSPALPCSDARSTKSRPFPPRRLCCPRGSSSTSAASDARPAHRPLPGSSPVIGQRLSPATAQFAGPGWASPVPAVPFHTFHALYAGEFLGAAVQDLHPFHGLCPEGRGSALPGPTRRRAHSRRGRLRFMLRTAWSLPPKGLLTLGFDPIRFQIEPPACYRAP